MSVDISIEELDRELVFDLFEVKGEEVNKFLADKQKKDVSDGISFQYKYTEIRLSEAIPNILVITVEIGKNVVLPIALGILSNYLYDKLKNRKNKTISVNGKAVEIDPKKIGQAILTNYMPPKEEKKEG